MKLEPINPAAPVTKYVFIRFVVLRFLGFYGYGFYGFEVLGLWVLGLLGLTSFWRVRVILYWFLRFILTVFTFKYRAAELFSGR